MPSRRDRTGWGEVDADMLAVSRSLALFNRAVSSAVSRNEWLDNGRLGRETQPLLMTKGPPG